MLLINNNDDEVYIGIQLMVGTGYMGKLRVGVDSREPEYSRRGWR